MSLAAQAEASSRIKTNGANVLTLDIERLPGSFTADFWDLNAFKNRRIHPDQVTEWPRTICVAWRWYGEKRTHFASEWDDGHDGMLRKVWDAYDRCEILYGHNVDRFDSRKLNSEWRDLGMNPPSPYKVVDTLKEARRTFGDESNTLAAITERLGIATKTDKYQIQMARDAVAGDKAAQRKLKAYNVGDVAASEALVDRLRGWLPSHPHLGTLDSDVLRCNQCASTNLERNGTYLAVQIRYVQYRCQDCGGNLRSAQHSRAANMRGAR